MSTVAESAASAVDGVTSSPREWSVADLCDRFGPILFKRIRHDPEPGTATEEDVVRLCDSTDRLFELVDGVLIEKTGDPVGSYVAALIASYLNHHVRDLRMGFVLGANGAWRVCPGRIRIPDVAYYAKNDLPGRRFPMTKMMAIAPRLAVEVVRPENTQREMDEKLDDYFQAGVRLVWLVAPDAQSAQVYTAPDAFVALDASQSLAGGTALPGYSLPLAHVFAELIDN